MMRLFTCFLSIALAVLLDGAVHASEVRAWLDRTSMQLGETVTLNVEVSGDARAAEPDLSALRGDFDLLGTQSSSSMNIINGQTSSKLLWAVGLQPKHAGTIAIAPLEVAGQKTNSLTLNVQPAAAGGGARAGDDVYIEVVADPHSPYVQQQIRFTVKMYFALNFSDGSLDDPQGEGLVVHKLGQDAFYAADVGGRRYRVWERRYALVPEKSGTLGVGPIVFRGHAIDPGDINSFFSRGRAVTARSEAITFDVRARPAASGTDAWLPARAVTLTASGIDGKSAARVGEPITLTVHLQAQGLGFEQLPDLKLPKIDGVDIYPDKSNTQNHDDGEWLFGERERKFALVPNRAGTVELPPVSLSWWDTAHDRAATAEIAASTLQVEPAAGAGTSSIATRPPFTPATDALKPLHDGTAVTSGAAPPAESELVLWRALAVAALLLWLATLLAWRVMRNRRGPAAERIEALHPQTAGPAAFRDAARKEDWSAAAHALLLWAQKTRPRMNSLGKLASHLANHRQAELTAELDRACYGGATVASDLGKRLIEGFSGGIQFPTTSQPSQRDRIVPPLYPSSG